MFKLRAYGGTLSIIAVAVLFYEWLTDVSHRLDQLLFPGLSKIIPALMQFLPDLLRGLYSSLRLMVPAYGLALVLGIGLGLVVGWSGPLRRNLTPIFRGLSPMPPTMYIPYAIAVLPTFYTASVFIIFIGSFWPILMGTIHGVVMVEQRHLDNAKMLNLRSIGLLRRVIFPAALPSIFSGASIALVFSFILLMVAEMFGSTSGLGYFIQQQADFSEYTKVLAALLFMSVFIMIVMALFDLIQRRALHWIDKR